MTKQGNKKLEKSVMDKIDVGKVRLRSKYLFLAKKLGLNGGVVLSFILAVLGLALIFVSLKMTGNLEYLSFGKSGWLIFIKNLPYGLIIISVGIIFLAGYLIKKSDWSYKIKFSYLAVIFLSLIIALSALVGLIRVSDTLAIKAMKHQISLDLIAPRQWNQDGSLRGVVVECDHPHLLVRTPYGVRTAYVVNEKIILPADCQNKIIIAIGGHSEEVFEIEKFKLLDTKRMCPAGRRLYREMPCPRCRMK